MNYNIQVEDIDVIEQLEDFKPVCDARQSVTKEKMIKHYGKELGLKKWNDAKNNKLNMLFIYPYFNDNWIFYKTHKNREDIKNNIKNYLYNYILEHFSNVENTQLIIGEKR